MPYARGTKRPTYSRSGASTARRTRARPGVRNVQTARKSLRYPLRPKRVSYRQRLARGVVNNAKLIKKLESKVLGPVQEQRSYFETTQKVTAHSPWCFQVNVAGAHSQTAPHGYHINATGHATQFHQFQIFHGQQASEDTDNVANHPCFLKYVKMEFEFKGFVDDTHVRIDIVRQKRMGTQDWFQDFQGSVRDNTLPYCLKKFQHLAGFTQERIDPKAWQVLKTRKLYFNSKGVSSLLDHANEDYPTVESTTSYVKRCAITVPFNRMLKPLDKGGYGENYGQTDQYMSTNGDNTQGMFSWWNQAPTHNVFCIISCSDQSALGATLTGDAISCKIHRTSVWRDEHD